MTPEEAYKKLTALQKRTRDRQRNHHRQSKAQGRAKVSVFLSVEASVVLERERNHGRTISEILSVALVEWYDQMSAKTNKSHPPVALVDEGNLKISPSKPKTKVNPKPKPPLAAPDNTDVELQPYDEGKVTTRIIELHNEGFSDPEIARRLEMEGWLTSTGKRQWNRIVVGRKRRAVVV